MEEKLLSWEDGTYRVSYDASGFPVSIVRVIPDGEEPVDGRLWATIEFEGIPVEG